MTQTYNHDPNIPDHDNPNYYVIHDVYSIRGKTYNVTAHCNKISDIGLHNLAEKILEIF